MPFIEKLQHWAATAPGRTAVIVGAEHLSYAQLFAAARERPSPGGAATGSPSQPGVAVIDRPPSVDLAIDFCAAVLRQDTAMVVDAAWPAGLREGLNHAAQDWASSRPVSEAPTDEFLLGLSSGTSGTPKAFVRTTASWRESFAASVDYFHVGPQSITLTPGPMAASMNLYALGESLYAGGTLVALERFSPAAALDAMRTHCVNRLVLVPTILELLALTTNGGHGSALASPDKGPEAGNIGNIVCAGSALTQTTVQLTRQWAPKALIQSYYGAAELGFVSSRTLTGGGVSEYSEDAGTAFPGAQISIRDRQGNAVPPGDTGSIYVRSPYVSNGYVWGDDGLAFGAITRPDGTWFTVHDRGWCDSLGALHATGRASDMILTSGANVYPQEVEEALMQAIPFTVIVTAVSDPVRGQRVVAAIHAAAADEPLHSQWAEVAAACRTAARALPAAHRPTAYFGLTSLPLTNGGKMSRTVLTRWIDAAADSTHDAVAEGAAHVFRIH